MMDCEEKKTLVVNLPWRRPLFVPREEVVWKIIMIIHGFISSIYGPAKAAYIIEETHGSLSFSLRNTKIILEKWPESTHSGSDYTYYFQNIISKMILINIYFYYLKSNSFHMFLFLNMLEKKLKCPPEEK